MNALYAMIDPNFAGGPERRCGEVFETWARMSPESVQLFNPDLTPAEYLSRLVENHLYSDAIRFVAHVLPKREAVYWACMVWGALFGPRRLSANQEAAFEAAIEWVCDPNEATRRQAETAARAAGFDNSAGCAAMAAFWSQGSMTPAHLPPVEVKPYLCGRMVSASVILTAAAGEYSRLDENKKGFLMLALEIDRGTVRWDRSENGNLEADDQETALGREDPTIAEVPIIVGRQADPLETVGAAR